ncbi:MAG: DEAD/DEAH box helicase family protein [Clostridia bacterium]|nr:DEAD/DEAH box helicase family protein [Clostridia bacterium]
MPISLFSHNEQAYASALSMLEETGKAAIVHPTGTGKSFIGFRLCEDFPDSTICWLSPSEYIFKTQIENLKAVSDGYIPQNIKFFTYAKLMNMDDEEISEIAPDYVVLDEFHRCGAEMWGRGVENLLKIHPDAKLLGLSATAVRYLDNQRDMSDELFDGNVASEMTLGEAIVRGILNPPKYVLSVFSYQKDLEKYEQRIRIAKSKAVRDAGERYLEALRRALEKADGMDVIFDKHMTERAGKYIVFCANFEHMHEMMELAPAWFAKVDKAPHIYMAYSDDPTTSREFAAFKADNSDHLKLLYCIDMLNEGVHVEDVCGVILLRPTISPIIYKQQIGRALSASKKTNAVIFDIVLNIENLYSIGAIEEEMEVAISYYRSMGLGEEIVNDQFKVVDEVRDCIALFDKLNDSLTASWDLMFTAAKKCTYHLRSRNFRTHCR